MTLTFDYGRIHGLKVVKCRGQIMSSTCSLQGSLLESRGEASAREAGGCTEDISMFRYLCFMHGMHFLQYFVTIQTRRCSLMILVQNGAETHGCFSV